MLREGNPRNITFLHARCKSLVVAWTVLFLIQVWSFYFLTQVRCALFLFLIYYIPPPLLCVWVCSCYPGKHHFLHALCNLVVTWTVLFLTQVLYHYIIWCSGSIQWEVKLEGRIESSAAIVGDFSQVVHTVYNLRCCFIIFSIAWALLIFSICHVLSGCSWLLQWENIFS